MIVLRSRHNCSQRNTENPEYLYTYPLQPRTWSTDTRHERSCSPHISTWYSTARLRVIFRNFIGRDCRWDAGSWCLNYHTRDDKCDHRYNVMDNQGIFREISRQVDASLSPALSLSQTISFPLPPLSYALKLSGIIIYPTCCVGSRWRHSLVAGRRDCVIRSRARSVLEQWAAGAAQAAQEDTAEEENANGDNDADSPVRKTGCSEKTTGASHKIVIKTENKILWWRIKYQHVLQEVHAKEIEVVLNWNYTVFLTPHTKVIHARLPS